MGTWSVPDVLIMFMDFSYGRGRRQPIAECPLSGAKAEISLGRRLGPLMTQAVSERFLFCRYLRTLHFDDLLRLIFRHFGL
jgi:hypothetical protein